MFHSRAHLSLLGQSACLQATQAISIFMPFCTCQVRNFGRSGRTKWTHLLEEDTTNYDDPAIKALAEKRRAVAGPAGAQEFSKPKKFRT